MLKRGQKSSFYGCKHREDTKKKISRIVKKWHKTHTHPNKGKILSKETRKKISEGLKGKRQSEETIKKRIESRSWYRPSEETKKKMSKAQKGKRLSEKTKQKLRLFVGKKHFQYGKHLSEEHKRKISEANKGKHRSEETKKKLSRIVKKWHKTHTPFFKGKKFSEEHKRKLRVSRLKQINPSKDTSIEVKLQDELSSRGYGYYTHYPIRGQPDIAFPDQKIAIFADGDFWHSNPSKFEARDKHTRGRTVKDIWEKDKKTNNKLQEKGWLILRYWESEIKANVEGVVDEIEDCLLNKLIL